jgi:predicted RNA-binding Zn-ribbon protein involved in translation (DUF1610 family)
MPIAGIDRTDTQGDQMNRRKCINCHTTWNSLADHELDAPHTCPQCGDELAPVNQVQPEGENAVTRVTP